MARETLGGRGRRRRGRVAVGAPAPPGRAPGCARRGSRGDPISARGRKTQGSRVWVGAGAVLRRGAETSTRRGEWGGARTREGRRRGGRSRSASRAGARARPAPGSARPREETRRGAARGRGGRRRERGDPRDESGALGSGRARGLGRASRARLRSRTSARMPARTTPSEPCARGCEGGDARAGDEENPIKPVSRAPGLAKTDWSRPRTKAHSCATVPTGSSRA